MNTTHTPHTAIPWTLADNKFEVWSADRALLGVYGANSPDRDMAAENRANAALIVRAVNSHDELVSCLKASLEAMDEAKEHLRAFQAVNQFQRLVHVSAESMALLSRLSA